MTVLGGTPLGLGHGREWSAVEDVRLRTARQLALQPRNLILEFGDTDRLTIAHPLGTIFTSSSSVVTHVRCSISTHVVTPLVTGYAGSVTTWP